MFFCINSFKNQDHEMAFSVRSLGKLAKLNFKKNVNCKKNKIYFYRIYKF